MLPCGARPGADRIFLHPFDPGRSSNATPIGQDGQGLHDVFLGCTPPIEEGPPSDGEGISTGLAQPSLGASVGMSEVDQIASIHFAVVGTLFIRAEGASLSYLRFCTHASPFSRVVAPTCV